MAIISKIVIWVKICKYVVNGKKKQSTLPILMRTEACIIFTYKDHSNSSKKPCSDWNFEDISLENFVSTICEFNLKTFLLTKFYIMEQE